MIDSAHIAVTVIINADDPQTIRAIELAADAGQWLVCHTEDGRHAFGVPSERDAGRYYLVTPSSCDCADFRRKRVSCKHMLAVRLHAELVRAQQHEHVSQRSRGHLRLISSG